MRIPGVERKIHTLRIYYIYCILCTNFTLHKKIYMEKHILTKDALAAGVNNLYFWKVLWGFIAVVLVICFSVYFLTLNQNNSSVGWLLIVIVLSIIFWLKYLQFLPQYSESCQMQYLNQLRVYNKTCIRGIEEVLSNAQNEILINETHFYRESLLEKRVPGFYQTQYGEDSDSEEVIDPFMVSPVRKVLEYIEALEELHEVVVYLQIKPSEAFSFSARDAVDKIQSGVFPLTSDTFIAVGYMLSSIDEIPKLRAELENNLKERNQLWNEISNYMGIYA